MAVKKFLQNGAGGGIDATFQPVVSSDIAGSTTNDNAPAGFIGEYLTASGSQSPLSNAAFDYTSLSLTAGDWEVGASIQTNTGGNITGGSAWVSATSATDPLFPNDGAYLTLNVPASTNVRAPIGTRRFSLAVTTTVFASAAVGFTVSNTTTMFIRARRVR